MTKIAVILPSYNEEVTIRGTIKAFHEALPEAEIVVVNNRSSDRTEEIARQTIEELACMGRVINENRPGKGNAVRRAFLDVDADVYLLSDADMTYPADRARDLMEPVLTGEADMVVGDRHSAGHYAAENKRPLHEFGNNLVRSLVNRLFSARLADVMSGYRAFGRVFVKNYPILSEGFEIETEMTLHALDKRFRIKEIPVEYQDRPEGSHSKLNTLRDGMRVLVTIVEVLRHYRPLLFFGGLAVFLAATGLIAGVPVFNDWIRERFIHRVPLAILATGLEILAALMLAVGLILDSIRHQNRGQFERDLLRGR